LNNANRAWQLFYDNQIDLLKNQLKDFIHFDHELSFDQIIQLIITRFEQQNKSNENIQLGKSKHTSLTFVLFLKFRFDER
jgi:hypothetical protein